MLKFDPPKLAGLFIWSTDTSSALQFSMTANVLMIQGTSSSAGKSLLVTALCRIYARRGVRVAPFKAQNMSNNAGVCADGAEIGRAQITQALAAGIEPTAQMNPVLLKPEANTRSQVIVLGKAWKTLGAKSYFERKRELWKFVTDALDQLREQYDLVIIEGAGSPAELNLKASDIVNMAVARYADAPVLLVGDIDRGGIFPQLLGTQWLLPAEEQTLLKGFIVNKFRGDPSLFVDGVQILEEKGQRPVLGVVPWLRDLGIPEEDAVALDSVQNAVSSEQLTDIAVVRLPRVANFDDFDALRREVGVNVRWVDGVQQLGKPSAIILPGTKSTMADLAWLRARGLADEVVRLAQTGTPVVGICGGYQMLGEVVCDPDLVEGEMQEMDGLGLLPLQTTFVGNKATHRASGMIVGGNGWLEDLRDSAVEGYEIHMGRTVGGENWLCLEERSGRTTTVLDGASSDDGKVWGCYLHGLFDNKALRRAWLRSIGWRGEDNEVWLSLDAAFDKLADGVEAALDMEMLDAIINGADPVC